MSTVGYNSRGTNYGSFAAKGYAESHECSDMAFFLNKHIRNSLKEQKEKTILDAGCGAAPWSIYAAQYSKHIEAIDIQEKMIEIANESIKQAGLSHKISAKVGDATKMPYKNSIFDHALSINVGCNLPPNCFDSHFKEISRILTAKGTADISAPDSLDILFTDNSSELGSIEDKIDQALENIPSALDAENLQKRLNEITGIISASFVKKDNRILLFTPSEKIKKGDQIWRKLYKVTIPNYYYSDNDYLEAFKSSGLIPKRIVRETFASEKERELFNNYGLKPSLGISYTNHSPFVIYKIGK